MAEHVSSSISSIQPFMSQMERGSLANSDHPWRAEVPGGICDKGKDKPFLPGSAQLALTIGPGFPLPTTLFAVAGKTFPGPSSYHLQGTAPSSYPEQLCAQNKTQPLLSQSTAWHCPKQPLSSHFPMWSSQLALKVSTPWHLHRSCNKPSVCRRLHNPLPIPPKFFAGLSPYLYRRDAVNTTASPSTVVWVITYKSWVIQEAKSRACIFGVFFGQEKGKAHYSLST